MYTYICNIYIYIYNTLILFISGRCGARRVPWAVGAASLMDGWSVLELILLLLLL